MARPRRSQATRASLVEEGVAAFLHGGYHGTGIKDVLDRVRVPKGSFYNYFESKEAFAAAAIQHYAACFVDRMDAELATAPDPLTGLKTFFDGLMRDFEEAGFVGGCLIGNLGGELEGSDICRTALADGFSAWRDRVAEALATAQHRGLVRTDLSAGAMADVLTESWEGAVIRMKIDRSTDPLRRVLDHLLGDYFQPRG